MAYECWGDSAKNRNKIQFYSPRHARGASLLLPIGLYVSGSHNSISHWRRLTVTWPSIAYPTNHGILSCHFHFLSKKNIHFAWFTVKVSTQIFPQQLTCYQIWRGYPAVCDWQALNKTRNKWPKSGGRICEQVQVSCGIRTATACVDSHVQQRRRNRGAWGARPRNAEVSK